MTEDVRKIRKPGDPFLHRENCTDYSQGCRCTACRAFNTARSRKMKDAYRRARVLIDGRMVATTARAHGLPSTYSNHYCRCTPCSDSHSVAMETARVNRQRNGYRTPQQRARDAAAADNHD